MVSGQSSSDSHRPSTKLSLRAQPKVKVLFTLYSKDYVTFAAMTTVKSRANYETCVLASQPVYKQFSTENSRE